MHRSPKSLFPGITATLLLLTTLTTSAQEVVVIEEGERIEAEIGPSDTLVYVVELEKGSFVYGEAIQHSVDVIVEVIAPHPRSRRIDRVDITGRGPDVISFRTWEEGKHLLIVTPFEEGSGRFDLVLHRVEPIATDPEGVVDQMMAAYEGEDRPGGVVAVFREGEVDFVRAYGMADLTHGVPNRPETLFNIGSTSKQFAGIFFAMMAERGELSLDDDVRKYLPELPDFGQTVTLRHLLNHTSGYREVYGPLGLQGRSVAGDILRREDAIQVVQNQPELQFTPGSRHLYNSTGYVLLTTIAERITDMPYPDWMEENVFEPLGMTSTMIEREPGQVMPGAATSYANARHEGYREDFEAYSYYGATDVYTNAADLARWLRNFRTSELGGAGVMRRMLEKSALNNGDTLRYTLGLMLDDHHGVDRIQHGGATGGYRTYLAYYPTLDAGVLVVSNTGTVRVNAVAEKMAEAFFEEITPIDYADIGELGSLLDSAELAPLFGSYWLDGRGKMEVEYNRYDISLNVNGRRWKILEQSHKDRNLWITSDRDLSILFHPGPDGTVLSATMTREGEGEYPLTRVTPLTEAPDLTPYIGRYFSEEVETFYTLGEEEGVLTLHHRRLEALPLRPEAADHFRTGWPVGEVIFERDRGGRVTGFRVNSGRMLGVHFTRVEE